MDALAELYQKQLILVMGKGGVGRTTVAAALAHNCANLGQNSLLYQASASEKMAHLLSGPASSTSITRVRNNLYTVNTTPQAALHEYGLMVLKFETIYRMVFENTVSKSLIRAIPGLDEYSILGKLWWHAEDKQDGVAKWDKLIFDTPATGHALSMLRIPDSILDAVPSGPLTRDAVKVKELLCDAKRTAVVIVTLAEEMPVQESLDLARSLESQGLPKPMVVVNQLYPPRFRPGTPSARILNAMERLAPEDIDEALRVSLERANTIRTRRALNDEYFRQLQHELRCDPIKLPLLFCPAFGHDQLKVLANHLALPA